MSRIDVDIAELERFIGQLVQYNRDLENDTYHIHGQFQELGSTWRDEAYEKFSEDWMSTFSTINKYLDSCTGYVRTLRVKAQKLRDAES